MNLYLFPMLICPSPPAYFHWCTFESQRQLALISVEISPNIAAHCIAVKTTTLFFFPAFVHNANNPEDSKHTIHVHTNKLDKLISIRDWL